MLKKSIFYSILICMLISFELNAHAASKLKHSLKTIESAFKGKNCATQSEMMADFTLLSTTSTIDYLRLVKSAKKATAQCLRNPSAKVRIKAMSNLQSFADAEKLGSGVTQDQINRMRIKIAIKDKDLEVRKAALAKASVPDKKTLKLVYKTLRKDPNEKIRELTAKMLAQNTEDQHVAKISTKVLKTMLKDHSAKVVHQAVASLTKMNATKDPAIAEAIKMASAKGIKPAAQVAVASKAKPAVTAPAPTQTTVADATTPAAERVPAQEDAKPSVQGVRIKK